MARDEQRPRGRARPPGVLPAYLSKFFTTDFTHPTGLRQLRSSKAEQLTRLESVYDSALASGPPSAATMELLRQEIEQIGGLFGKCETDLGSLTAEEGATAEAWLHTRDRSLAVIPVAAVLAGRHHVDRPTCERTGDAGP
ncbi:hypothetical protein [Streptomyces spinosirectus]